LSRLFTTEAGTRFRRWQRQVRLLTALELLAEGRLVTEVAFEVGYDSRSAFINAFRRTFGTPPALSRTRFDIRRRRSSHMRMARWI